MKIQLNKFEEKIFSFIKDVMIEDQAHDIHHILRVVKTAKYLCIQEKAILEVVLPAAYLHDCFSLPKNHPERTSSSKLAADKAINFLASISYPNNYFDAIHHAITAHSFSASVTPQTLEAQLVQDADRLDALGAIGIARCLQVSTSLGVQFYNVNDPFCLEREPDDRHYTIDHFYKKLFALSETMNSQAAKKEAEIRTNFMKDYLYQLQKEV